MRAAHDYFLTLRLPAAMRRDLDAAARAGGTRLSVVTRNALAVGLAAIRSPDTDRDPPASPGAASMRAAA